MNAIVLLALYYIAAPPWVGFEYSIPQEGAYVIVNKNLVELFALCVTLLFSKNPNNRDDGFRVSPSAALCCANEATALAMEHQSRNYMFIMHVHGVEF